MRGLSRICRLTGTRTGGTVSARSPTIGDMPKSGDPEAMRQMELLADAKPRATAVEKIRPAGLRVMDAARYLGVSRWTIQRMIRADELDAYYVGRLRLVTLESLDRHVAKREPPKVVGG